MMINKLVTICVKIRRVKPTYRKGNLQISFFSELKRRNLFKVAAAYTIVGWRIMQAFFLILDFPLAKK